MDDNELINIFRDKGFKVTVQRLAICKYVLARNDHPSADQTYQALRIDYPTISLGTVYKTIHLLQELGLVQELGFNEGSIRYDPDTELHINMVCTKCGEIHDYKPDNIIDLWEKLTSNLDVELEGQRIDLYYQCSKCKK